MIALLTFLLRYCSCVFERPGFRFKDSGVGRNAAEGSRIHLESPEVEMFIGNEREELTWRIRSTYDSSKRNWFSFDLVAQLLGHDVSTGVMTEENCELLKKDLPEILDRFSESRVSATLRTLKRLKAERTKRI